MADRAATLTGSFQKVTLGATSKVLGPSKYEISGITRRTVDCSEFGVDIDIFEFGAADGGTITLSDFSYDPTDPAQNYLRKCAEEGIKLGGGHGATSGLHFWINSSSALCVGTSGHILLTNAGKVSADRNGLARTDLSGKISGAFMYLS